MEDLQRQTLTEGETEYIINWKFSGTSVRSYNVSLVFLYKQSHLETMVVPMMVVWKLKQSTICKNTQSICFDKEQVSL